MLTPVPSNLLDALAATAPAAESQPANGMTTFPRANDFNIDRWIATYATDAGEAESWPGGGQGARRWVFKVCPFNPEHKDHSAAIVQYPNGKLGFNCHHNGCAGKDWHAFRKLREPQAATRPIHSAAPIKGEVAAESNLTFHTAREIAVSTPAAVEWVSEPWAARGAITEVDGRIKAAGKTTWTLAMCRKALDGDPFLGKPTAKTAVIYLTEQPSRSFREALRRADLLDRDDFYVLYYHEAKAATWPAIVATAIAKAKAVGAWLLVVDTLPQWAGLRGDGENNAGAALEAVAPLQEAAALHGLSVIIVRHERKSGGEVGDSGRGSSAFGGAVDIVLSIRRADGNARPAIRVIQALSRFDETPDTLTVELIEGEGYVSHGTETAVAVPEAMAAILATAPTAEAYAEPLGSLLKRVKNVRRTVAQEAVKQLQAAGSLKVVGKGVKGDPHRYWKLPTATIPGFDSAATSLSIDAAESISPTRPPLAIVRPTGTDAD